LSQSPFNEKPESNFGGTLESTVLVLAERMAGLRSAIVDLSGQIKALQDQAESRIRNIENWKTGVEARVDLVQGQWKFICALAGLISIAVSIIGHYWK
jgi:hypothetical protein